MRRYRRAEQQTIGGSSYMRRATNTIDYSGELSLAQGVTFTV